MTVKFNSYFEHGKSNKLYVSLTIPELYTFNFKYNIYSFAPFKLLRKYVIIRRRGRYVYSRIKFEIFAESVIIKISKSLRRKMSHETNITSRQTSLKKKRENPLSSDFELLDLPTTRATSKRDKHKLKSQPLPCCQSAIFRGKSTEYISC